jgi:RNA polymerase subunit RPABC4/transcription elongation factor Spt4
MERLDIIEKNASTLLRVHYKSVAEDSDQRTVFCNHEFKVHSKHGNDGLILYIFSKIGTTNRTFVEIGVEDGKECNTANLSLNFGWQGMLIDANKEWLEIAKDFYQEKLRKNALKIKIVPCFVTAENINKLLLDNGLQNEIDLLSIDIDGNDYWVWKAITAVNPRVVVIEYNSSFGLKPITVKYDPKFYYKKTYKKNPLYFGASLSALAKLGNSKGYVLVGCDSHGHDAFFVRKDAIKDKLIELPAAEAFYPRPYLLKTIGSIEKQFNQVKHLDFEDV